MDSPLPLTRDLVLIGGGHAHALVLRRWSMAPLPGARLTLISPGPTAAYSGMLPGHVAGHYPRDALRLDLVRLARAAGARLILGAACGLDRTGGQEGGRVLIGDHPPVRYDVVSIDVGITLDLPQVPGFAEHGLPAKPLERFADAWEDFCTTMRPGMRPQIVLIGAGVAGVELALAMDHRLRGLGTHPALTLIEGATALRELPRAAQAHLRAALARAGIALHEGRRVARVGADHVLLDDGQRLGADLTLGTGTARPQGWIAGLGLPHQDGFLTVDRYLRAIGDGAVFAVGDCAHLGFAPRPKAGVYAVRAAPVLWRNLRAALGAGARVPFRPQRDFLKLISLGGKSAVAMRGPLVARGPALWRWKDRIDRRFMARLADLPRMPRPRLPAAHAAGLGAALGRQAPCGACGAKMGAAPLRAALARLPAPARADVLSQPGDDAAILHTGGVRQVLSTDHLRAFTLDPVQMARITALHALGDIWAMGAAPQAAVASITLPRMSAPMQEATLAEVMETAAAVFRAAGADLVGGHTTLGPEMQLGFAVTGLCARDPITLAGGQPNDALILTRPLGSGTILAAEMAMRAPGGVVAAALGLMGRPQGDAAALLAGAHAMTDVTGFGLAGHLGGMVRASGCAAVLRLAAVPLMEGALALAERGWASTLAPANRSALAGLIAAPDTPRAGLLFDPQTAGGLLAAVAPETAPGLIAGLHALGHPAAVIGHLTAGAPAITLDPA